ncbi:hematopoietically-expressed homeobox protein Hhex-like [Eriocheir sinensis]|uniref:hematopoietically-expressed homeobox protein Hhex-like n=1 Tax=Eriocheir sinensis TaxID=95602 RepID=UPI0021C8862B|nr:hematopoietically-expressed homeobox protein Hhex-like [Eriocheir sinensis]
MPPLPSISCSAFLQHPTLARPQSPSLDTHTTPQSLYPTLDLLQGPQKPGYHPANSSRLSSIHTALFNPRSATLPPIHPAQLHHPQGLYHHPVTRFKTTEEVGFFRASRLPGELPAYPVTCPPGHPHTAWLSTGVVVAVGSGRTRRCGGQVQFTAQQTRQLETWFSQYKYITAPQRKTIARELSLHEKQVMTWYQNKQAKSRNACPAVPPSTPQDFNTTPPSSPPP